MGLFSSRRTRSLTAPVVPLSPMAAVASRMAGVESVRAAGLHDLISRTHLELIPLTSVEQQISLIGKPRTISITCSPKKGIGATLTLAGKLISAGHRVVPHLSARMVESPAHLEQIAEWLTSSRVREIFVIAGDGEHRRGPYGDSVVLIEALLGAGVPLDHVGSAGYPDGHPAIDPTALQAALFARQELLDRAGVAGWVSTQMCFEPERTISWVRDIRAAGLHLPIHVGVPGPIDVAKLLTLGMRLGVGQSMRYLKKNRSATQLVGFDPIDVLRPIAEHASTLAITGVHLFTFNQVAASVDWLRSNLSSP